MPEIVRSRLEFPSREKMTGWALTRWRALTQYSTVQESVFIELSHLRGYPYYQDPIKPDSTRRKGRKEGRRERVCVCAKGERGKEKGRRDMVLVD